MSEQQTVGEFIDTAIPNPGDTTRIRINGRDVTVTHVATYDWSDWQNTPKSATLTRKGA